MATTPLAAISWPQRPLARRRHLMARLFSYSLASTSTGLARSLPRRVAMDLLDDAAHDCVKRSTTSRTCRRRRGRYEHRNLLMQPAGAAAAASSQPTAWLASPLAERWQRGAASNVERATHEAAGRGRRRGQGLVVLRRVATTESAGARRAGLRDQCRQREGVGIEALFEGLSASPGWAFNCPAH